MDPKGARTQQPSKGGEGAANAPIVLGGPAPGESTHLVSGSENNFWSVCNVWNVEKTNVWDQNIKKHNTNRISGARSMFP